MKSRIYPIICLMLIAVFMAGICANCGSNTPKTAETSAAVTTPAETAAASTAAAGPKADEPGWKLDTSPITFDLYFNANWFAEKWGAGDTTTAYITKKTGVSFNNMAPTGSEAEKVTTMIASGTLPDFCLLGYWEDTTKKIIEGGLVLPLNKLANQYDPYFYNVFPKSIQGWYTEKDGNIYGVPNFAYPPEKATGDVKLMSNSAFMVRKDMYEAIGSPDMTTPEGFLNALKAAKEKFPKVDGQPLIPIGFHEFIETGCHTFSNILPDFLAVPWAVDNKIIDRTLNPDFSGWMKTFRKANEMGLISKDVFIDKRTQMEEKITKGRYFSIFYQRSDLGTPNSTRYNQDPNSYYMAVEGPRNLKGDKPTLAGNDSLAGWMMVMISKTCKDPQRAVRTLDYLFSEEGQKDMYLGEKGVTYDTVDGKDAVKPELWDLLAKDKTGFRQKYLCYGEIWTFYDPYTVQKWKPADPMPDKQSIEWTEQYAVPVCAYTGTEPAADSPEGLIYKKQQIAFGTLLPKLILSKSDADFDKLWNDYQSYLTSINYQSVLDYKTQKYIENKAKLGQK